MTSALISIQQLANSLDKVKLLDASYGLPWTAGGPRIGHAQFFDIDDIADPDAPLPHTLPSADLFAAKAGALGLRENDSIVIYDRAGISMAACRAWWMFRVFGHKNVFVLDGGLPKWLAEGLPVRTETKKPIPAVYHTRYRPELIRYLDQMVKNLSTKNERMIDARAGERFYTTQGHIPGSCNLPYMTLINKDGTLKGKDDLRAAMAGAKIDLSDPITTTCGSGVTACVLALALYELGRDDIAVYDGSWTEWAQNPNTPKVTSACQEKKAN